MATLDGIRVIDFGQYIAGPLAAVMLADQGAEVIHVDPPSGPRWRSDADAFYNRGKQRITLDLKQPDDHAIAQGLIATADVVIENFRPGVMPRLGLGARAMTERDPRLIYCSIPGFASDDPRRNIAAWEGVVGAATDTYATIGQLLGPDDPRVDDADRPVFTALPLASNFGGFHAATAIVMALIARGRSGRGQTIEVPLFDAMFELIGANGISVDGEYRMARSRGATTYVCQDGRRILFNSSSTPRFLRWFAQAAGVPSPAALDHLSQLFLTRPAKEWEELINAAGGPTTMVRSAAEWMASDQARQRRTVIQLDDPELGPTWMAGMHVHMTDSPGSISPRHQLDADRAMVLSALETSQGSVGVPPQDDVRVVEDDAPPLSGLKVLDLTQVVAGPCTGRILVEYGADVIKINNPRPDSLTAAVSLSGRPTDPGNQQHEHLNRGKQTLLLDLRTPGGLQVFRKLLDQTDVVMQNFAQGMAETYGIAYEQVRSRKPDLVYFSLSAYGYGGPMGTYRGFEGNAQAVTGLMHRFGGDGPPLGQPYLLDDYGTGIRGAFAIALGVFHRQRTGRGQHINIALAETATYHQAAFLLDHPRKIWDEPRGIFSRGCGPLQRLYKASDGWFFLGTDSRQRLDSVEGLADVADAADSVLERLLEARFAENVKDNWVSRLRQAGIGAHATARVEDLMQDRWVRDHGLSITQRVEGVGNMTMPGVAARLSRTPLRVGEPVHPAGADAAHVLAQIGLVGELDQLVANGAISTSLTQSSVLSPLPIKGGVAMELQQHLSRRSALTLLVSTTGMAVLAACVPTQQPATQQSAPKPSGQARPGGILNMGLASEPANVDGHTRTPGSAESVWLAFDRLSQYDDKLKAQPALAESWDLSSDYKQIKFNLRKGVTWHSGREFTSEDVKWNFLRVRDPKVAASTLGSYSAWFTTIDLPDKNTVILKSEQPRPTMFDAFELFNMLDPQVMEGADAKSKAPGTGPFILQEWAQGDHMTFVKNKNYWQSGKPLLDGITVKIFRGEQPAMSALEGGSIEAMRMDSVRDVVRLKADPKYTVWEHPNPGTFFELAFNVTVPPFDNKKVRQAFNYAFDRKRLTEQIYQGTATPSALPWSSSSPGYDAQKAKAYAFDLDKARALLQEANVSALELDVIGIANGYPLLETFMQAYQADLAKLGVKLNIKVMEGAQWIDQANNHKYNGMYYSGDNNAHVNPATLWSGSPGWRPLAINNSGWDNPKWKEYVATISVETDPAKQKSLIAEINDFALDESWVFPVSSQPTILMSTNKLQSVVPTMHNGFYYDTAWLTA